jgi:hypothetical protein
MCRVQVERFKELGMKKLTVLAGAFCTALLLAGCSSDVREALIDGTIGSMNKAASSLTGIKDNVDKWDKEKKETDKNALLKKAIEGTNSLRTAAQGLLRVKQEAMQLEPATKEQREEYRKKYQERIAAATESVSRAQDGLNQALVNAEKNHPDQKTALTELKQKLQLAQAEFELQAKQQ